MTHSYTNSSFMRDMLDQYNASDIDHTVEYLAENLEATMDRFGESPIRVAVIRSTVRIAGEEVRVQTSMSEKYYHGCKDCAHFSLAFVGAPYFVTEEDAEGNDWTENQIITLHTDEDFENLKTLFVTHFNKQHRDILLNKEKDTRKYNIVPKINLKNLTVVDDPSSNTQHIIADHVIFDEAQYAITGESVIRSTVPEFEVVVDPETGIARTVSRRMRD